MHKVFISYRRQDTAAEVEAITKILDTQQSLSYFHDTAGGIMPITLGRDYVRRITAEVVTSHAVLAIIGAGWVNAKYENGKRRLEDPADVVRRELVTAISARIPIIPVLVQGATLPRNTDLPACLLPLLDFHSVEIPPDQIKTARGYGIAQMLLSVGLAVNRETPADLEDKSEDNVDQLHRMMAEEADFLARIRSVMNSGSLDDALVMLEVMCREAQFFKFEAHLDFGDIWAAKRMPQLAEREYRRALRLKPLSVEASMKLAKALLEQNLTDNALEVLDGCIYLSGNNPVFITEKANALEQLGRHSEAAKLAEESKRLKAAFASAIAD